MTTSNFYTLPAMKKNQHSVKRGAKTAKPSRKTVAKSRKKQKSY